MKAPNPKNRVVKAQPTVAVLYPGGRKEKLLKPLDASDLDYTVEPSNPAAYDVIMLDQPRKRLADAVVRYRNTSVAYRVRGNIWREMDIWRFGKLKKLAAEHLLYPALDGAVAVDDRLANIFESKTGTWTGVAGLAKDPANWPTATHDSRTLNLITLTNMNYNQKVEPIYTHLEPVNDWLDAHGGHWYICGEGIYEDDVRTATDEYQHISYAGFVDPHDWLGEMDVMLHLSNFDAYPNAILEGYASELPVLTNDFAAFDRPAAPNISCESPHELTDWLDHLQRPQSRTLLANEGVEYLEANHTYSEIGKQYERLFTQLYHDSH